MNSMEVLRHIQGQCYTSLREVGQMIAGLFPEESPGSLGQDAG